MDQESRDFIAQLPTEPAAPDPARLQDLAGYIRGVVMDPQGAYAGRPDLQAKAELDIKATLLRAGVTERVETPLEAARRRHDESFSYQTPQAVLDLIEDRVTALEALGADVVKERAAALRKELGPAAYDLLADEAKAALLHGEALPPAALADRHALTLMAAQGRYFRAYEATKPRG